MFYSEKNYAYYEELKHFLDAYENSYKDFLMDTKLKKFRFDCRKAVNIPLNTLSPVSALHMRDKYEKLAKLLKGNKVKVLDTYVRATEHCGGLKYCTALLAKKIVRQGDVHVSRKSEAAFPLAAIAVTLCSLFPEFGKLLEAYFYKYCPYLVPIMLPQIEGQSDEDFYKNRGYIYNDEGAVEKQDIFLSRMSGMFKLHCAIWLAKTPTFVNSTNPYNVFSMWRWLSSFINLKPDLDISATLLYDFFTVCGSEFIKRYGKQCLKVIKLLNFEYILVLNNIDQGGPKTRLEIILNELLKTGDIPPIELLPLNTW